MKIIGYIWTIFINIITVGIVVACFSVASTNFEIVILSVLVLIYLSICGFMNLWSMSQLELSQVSDNQFEVLKGLLSKETKKELDDDEKELQDERIKAKKNIAIKFYIGATFSFIIYVIAIFNLLTAL